MRKGLYDWMYRNHRVPWDIGPHFTIEKLVERRLPGYIAGEAAYLMTRKGEKP